MVAVLNDFHGFCCHIACHIFSVVRSVRAHCSSSSVTPVRAKYEVRILSERLSLSFVFLLGAPSDRTSSDYGRGKPHFTGGFLFLEQAHRIDASIRPKRGPVIHRSLHQSPLVIHTFHMTHNIYVLEGQGQSDALNHDCDPGPAPLLSRPFLVPQPR